MRIIYATAIAVIAALPARAQTWTIDAGAGLSFGRLLPKKQSTPQSESLKYGFTTDGIYISPELHFAATEHHHFTFGYQYSINAAGILFKTPVSDAYDWEFDMFELHNFSVGYQYHQYIFADRLHVVAYGKMGLGYGYGTGSGSCTNAGHFGSETFTYYELKSESKIAQTFWTPNTTVGIALGPNFKNRRMADRLTLQASVTACWKNIYSDYSSVNYTLVDASGNTRAKSILYQGAPLLLQVGINFRMIDFVKD